MGYVSDEFQVSATTCVVTNIQTSDTSASGSFDCANAIIVRTGGTTLLAGRIKGTFRGARLAFTAVVPAACRVLRAGSADT